MLQVSENITKVLKAGRPLSNQSRLQARKLYLFPDVEVMWCPKLDPVAKQLLLKEQKPADAALARLQTLVVDAVAPLTLLLEWFFDEGASCRCSKAAITLLGNATTQISRERRKKVIQNLNKKVHPSGRSRI